MIRRLNAEADEENQFSFPAMADTVQQAGDRGHVVGRMGFGSTNDVCAVLIPEQALSRPLALGIVYEKDQVDDPQELITMLQEAVMALSPQMVAKRESMSWMTQAA